MAERLAIEGGTPVRAERPFLVYGAPAIKEDEIDEVVRCLQSGWIGTGPKVKIFEDEFAAYKEIRYAVALNSCTAALHLALLALGIGPGDEVITTPMTFCSTVNAIIHSGATPVLADCDPESMNILPEEIGRKVSENTKAIMPVHFGGRCCDMERIMGIADQKGLFVIEDCAHAIEAEYRGRKAGAFGNIGCFSFYVTKNVVTGEGGMIATEDKSLADKIKTLGLHGLSKDAWSRFSDQGYRHYQVVQPGYKYNMMDIQAAMGIHQLRRVEENWERRKEIWQRYNEAFLEFPCSTPPQPEDQTRHAYHLYPLLIDIEAIGKTRDWVLNALTAEKIGVGVHYLPIHSHPFYRETFGWEEGDFPHAEFIGARTISLPLSSALSDGDVEDVVTAVRKVLSN